MSTPNYSGARSPAWNAMTVQDGKTGYMELLFPWQQPGQGLYRIDENGNVTANSFGSVAPAMALQAATPVAGVALATGTPTILSWTPPNDGLMHRALLVATLAVTSTERPGAVNFAWTAPGGQAATHTAFAGAQATGVVAGPSNNFSVAVEAGAAVTLAQSSSLTGGAAVLYAEIWGS